MRPPTTYSGFPIDPFHVISRGNFASIARSTGLSLSGVSRILRGRRNPTRGSLVLIAQTTGLEVDVLAQELERRRKVARAESEQSPAKRQGSTDVALGKFKKIVTAGD